MLYGFGIAIFTISFIVLYYKKKGIRNNIVKQIGFKHEEHDGDWFYFNDAISLIKNPKEEMKKTNKVLFVHN